MLAWNQRKVRQLVVMAFLAALLVAYAIVQARRWLDVDRCLDAGGRWDADAMRCDFGPGASPRRTQ